MKATQIGRVSLAALTVFGLTQRSAATQGSACARQEQRVIHLGFSFSCNCIVSRDPAGSDTWTFHSEPRVDQAAGDGELRAGDAIVMANQRPITTDAGGAAFSRLYAGRPVALTVRRGGRLTLVRVTPVWTCTPRGADRETSADSGSPDGGLVTRGYLGLGLSTRATVEAPPGGPAIWHFAEPPVVIGVAAGGPAERAGLRIGDSVTAVDGYPVDSDDAGRRFGAALPGETLRLEVRRGGATLRLAMTVADRDTTPLRLEGRRVEVTGPARVERVGHRIVIWSDSGSVAVVVYP